MPGTAGALNAAIEAAGNAFKPGCSAAMMPAADSRREVRWLQSFSTTMSVPELDWLVPEIRLKPDSSMMLATPASLATMPPTWCTTVCVRSSEAPLGSMTLTKK